MKKRVIIVTDGDMIARKAVELATKNIGGRCISMSAGNPTVLTGAEILELIKMTPYDPVVVMVDDRGDNGMGKGEKAMNVIINNQGIDLIGIVAVASNTQKAKGVKIDCSVDKYCNFTSKAVDKCGNVKENKILKGDTVNTLAFKHTPFIVGIGDPGKMDGNDCIEIGAPVITAALEKIVENYNQKNKQ